MLPPSGGSSREDLALTYNHSRNAAEPIGGSRSLGSGYIRKDRPR